jgi:threonylcarbamoyladenosine tRNA methylthiotransferase MtaB
MKTFKIYTLGCKVNQYDSTKLSRDLKQLGLFEVAQGADLAIVNTCTVTHSALAKDKKMLDEARVSNPGAKLAIVGCMPVNYRAEAEQLGVDYIYGAKELDAFVEKLKIENLLIIENCELKIVNTKSRYFLKIQDGCRQFCSYCIIAHNRGPLASRDRAEIIDEVRQVTEQGIAEVVLCGIHLGLYGVDNKQQSIINNQYLLVDLLLDLFKIETLKKVRLSSIEVTEVTDELIGLMKTKRKFARHLHIPLQAGCDKILKSMNRPYGKQAFRERLAKLRVAAPEVAITTDVIVGFPGETAEDFAETLEFCRELHFSKIHVFPFSAHAKTPAYHFPDQLPDATKKQRASALQKLSDELEREYKQSFIGKTIEVIVDGRSKFNNENGAAPRDGKAILRGKSEYYFDIIFKSDERFKVGQMVKIENWNFL